MTFIEILSVIIMLAIITHIPWYLKKVRRQYAYACYLITHRLLCPEHVKYDEEVEKEFY